MTDNLTIVQAVYSGQSQRQVAVTHRVSRNTVALFVQNAKAQGNHYCFLIRTCRMARLNSNPSRCRGHHRSFVCSSLPNYS